jgi:hypothetical protein
MLHFAKQKIALGYVSTCNHHFGAKPYFQISRSGLLQHLFGFSLCLLGFFMNIPLHHTINIWRFPKKGLPFMKNHQHMEVLKMLALNHPFIDQIFPYKPTSNQLQWDPPLINHLKDQFRWSIHQLLRFKYMDIQPRFVKPSYKTFTLDPAKIKAPNCLWF